MTLSENYLVRQSTYVPIDVYSLGTTVLMWHMAIWEYIGQAINMFCSWVKDEKKLSFMGVTSPRFIESIPAERLYPIHKAELAELAAKLRSIRGGADSARSIRNITTHRYHIAYTYNSDFEKLVRLKPNSDQSERVRRFQKEIERSLKALIRAQDAFQTFLQLDTVKQWQPFWFSAGDKEERGRTDRAKT
jgi:hypothetical protein